MRYRRLRPPILAAVTVLLMPFLGGCGGGGDDTNQVNARSILGTWTGKISRAADSLSLTITFTADGSGTTGVAKLALLNEPAFSPPSSIPEYFIGSTPVFPVD